MSRLGTWGRWREGAGVTPTRDREQAASPSLEGECVEACNKPSTRAEADYVGQARAQRCGAHLHVSCVPSRVLL